VGATDLIKAAANLTSPGAACTYFACWYVVRIIAVWFIGFETKGRSPEESDGTLSGQAQTATAKATGRA
jgi:hypothetical protein